MDPLSITVSVVALSEAGRRLIHLLLEVRKSLSAIDEIDALRTDIHRLNIVLHATYSILPLLDTDCSVDCLKILEDCYKTIQVLETEMRSLKKTCRKRASKACIQLVRMHWMSRKAKIEVNKVREIIPMLSVLLSVSKL